VKLKLKRIYEAPSEEDGLRILVDRLWPRGLSKEKAKIDLNAAALKEYLEAMKQPPA
jgi:uncharacterized protein YeaO (DUF488 family)